MRSAICARSPPASGRRDWTRGSPPRLPTWRAPPEVEAAAYFVACEALTNALKHASPTRVVLETTRADGQLRMVIADDGVGGAAAVSGRGLAGMHDRVAAHGGTLEIESPPGAGTRIAVELPCAS